MSAALTSIVFASLATIIVPAQNRQSDSRLECRGPIYNAKDVTRRAKIIERPDLKGLSSDLRGRVLVDAVLCRTGRVTDIRIVESSPPSVAEFAIAAVSEIRFKPAELNWHTVSQRMEFQFSVNDGRVEEIDPSAATGRLVEELDIMGNRRMTKEQILPMIKTRPRDIFNQDQVQRDLTAILATGNFNPIGTRVLLEDALRGGVRVIFKVFELPLIRRLWFRGVTAEDEFAIMEELVKPQLNIRIGAPSHPLKLRAATVAIKQYLESAGWSSVNVETLIENLSATEVNITFTVSGLKPKL